MQTENEMVLSSMQTIFLKHDMQEEMNLTSGTIKQWSRESNKENAPTITKVYKKSCLHTANVNAIKQSMLVCKPCPKTTTTRSIRTTPI